MDEEIECIEKIRTWELVDVPKDKDVISVKWMYKTKKDADGNVQKQSMLQQQVLHVKLSR